ncbi:MAG: hypothetical protein A2289_18985 [Deltaproteobacteria bacterium RIFOXYA12_FULL_58_15]|nr:MAG: hypothetical protein A2289_18985 [Deltaproteobacteria bacterium RIFOXYA12_FULL_58_15]OGR11078.1 MAG: hypothetical protein A2341_08030 [Deltaproteobacteria bacterium RIFOXYB12_FULL_58_9]
MALLAVIGGLLLALAIVVREYQLSKDRKGHADEHERMALALKESRTQLRRAIEDVHVLQCVLQDKHLLDETELAAGRVRHIDGPRRAAAERNAIVQTINISPTQLVIDEDITKIH